MDWARIVWDILVFVAFVIKAKGLVIKAKDPVLNGAEWVAQCMASRLLQKFCIALPLKYFLLGM